MKKDEESRQRDEAGWVNYLFIVSGNTSCLSVPVQCINKTKGILMSDGPLSILTAWAVLSRKQGHWFGVLISGL